jgi:hypothetical protein
MTGLRTRIRLHAVVHEPQPETPLERARKRYGKPFGFERGTAFRWTSGPSVLTEWAAKYRAGKAHG